MHLLSLSMHLKQFPLSGKASSGTNVGRVPLRKRQPETAEKKEPETAEKEPGACEKEPGAAEKEPGGTAEK